jgi:hypothetical protein
LGSSLEHYRLEKNFLCSNRLVRAWSLLIPSLETLINALMWYVASNFYFSSFSRSILYRLSQHCPSIPFSCHSFSTLSPAHLTNQNISPQPYDCGFFLTHSLQTLTNVCKNPNAAYLVAGLTTNGEFIPSPLNIGLENSRRFRALPAYAVLVAHGRQGLSEMFARQVRLARAVAHFVDTHPGYKLLPAGKATQSELASEAPTYASTGIIVLFRAVDDAINADLGARINKSCRIMVSGTVWEGKPAVRIAVSTWKVDVERDLKIVREVLEDALL